MTTPDDMKYIYEAKVVRVVDGDTYDFLVTLEDDTVDVGFKITRLVVLQQHQRHRLREVDTWETHNKPRDSEHYQKGVAATEAVRKWFEGHVTDRGTVMIQTVKDRTGKYGRYLVNVFDINTDESLVDFLRGSEHEKTN